MYVCIYLVLFLHRSSNQRIPTSCRIRVYSEDLRSEYNKRRSALKAMNSIVAEYGPVIESISVLHVVCIFAVLVEQFGR